MSIFGRATFASTGYAAFRPSYGPQLYRSVLGYHDAGRNASPGTNGTKPTGTLLDLGCGHGLISQALAPSFARVFAVDPSAGMVEEAGRLAADPKISIRKGFSHELSFLDDSSVDIVVSGQAAHWFDYARTWPELARVVKPGGTLAFWGYKDHAILGHPTAGCIFDKFNYGERDPVPGMEGLARFWELPGREILRDSYQVIVPPEADWEDVKRSAWDPDRKTDNLDDGPEEALWLRKRLKLGQLENYARTYSSYNAWRDAHPDLKSRAEGGAGDIVDKMWDEVLESVPEWKTKGEGWREIEVEVVWGTAMLLARRRRPYDG